MSEVDFRQRSQTELSVGLIGVAVFCAVLVFIRAWHGELHGLIKLRSPMNLEGICALALLLVAMLRSRSGGITTRDLSSRPGQDFAAMTGLCALVTLAFVPFLGFPFLADDYDHIWNARHITASSAIAHFTKPEADHFFRPLVYLSYGVEALFAGLHPAVWRAISLTWHLVAALLVWALIRRLTPSRFAAFAGAALFAIHGTRPEAVTWVASRFDLMATALGLAALNLLLRMRNVAAAAFLLMALLCKESAFAFPMLAFLVLRVQKETWQACIRRTAPFFALATIVFLYRLSVLGEIGGYHNAGNGRPTIFNLRLTTTLKGVFVRSWAAVLVPLNWTNLPGPSLAILLLGGILGFAFLAWRGGDRRTILLGLAFFCVAALPVHQFLSIGDDLEKSRVLYLPLVGVSILLAGLVTKGLSRNSILALSALLLFQFVALEHNLQLWESVGRLAAKTCEQVASEIDKPSGEVVAVPGLPNVIDGVYFLKTGFPACVWLQRPEKQARVTAQFNTGDERFRWSEKSRKLVEDEQPLSPQ